MSNIVAHEQRIKRIALVVTYFGKLPFWFPAFQLSCSYNHDIQWIIFSDAPQPSDCPLNISFIKFTADEFCQLASRKLSIDVRLSNDFLYKICDFKPAFGIIYEDFLSDYDFWGHCDIDIIWGRINKFVTPELLRKYDIITSRLQRISGHFCLYRNTEKINRIFLEMPWTVELLQKERSYERLDEEYFTRYLYWLMHPTFLSHVKQFFAGKPFVPKIYWDKVLTTSGRHQRALLSNEVDYFRWENRKVYHTDGTERMYLHFHVLKSLPTFTMCNIEKSNSSFFLSAHGINGD
ncbi:hypothetical protein GKODMF_10795 [Candidatus Electrothrix gigas]